MKPFRLAGVLLIAASLAGCSSITSTVMGWFGSGKSAAQPAKLTEIKTTAKIDVLWRHDVGDTSGNVLGPAATQDAVYAANNKGGLFRIDRASGKEVWHVDTGFTVSGGVGAGEGLVLVGGSRGDVSAYGEDGKLVWNVKASSEVLSAPQVSGGIVVVRTGDGRIAGLRASDGKRLWLFEHATPALIVRSHAGVLIDNGTVYAGFAGGKLAAIRLTDGVAMWESAVSQPRGNTELERISDITSLPVVGDGIVCAVAFQGNVACFDIAQGNLLWSREISSDKGMALAGKYIYLTDADGSVSGLDKSSGSSLWKNDSLSLRRVTAPGMAGSHAVVGDYEGYLHALNRDDGGFSARVRLDSAVAAAPVSAGDTLFVQTVGGGVYAVAVH